MKKSLWFPLVAVLAVVAVFAFTQQAQAATRHLHVVVVPQNPGDITPDVGAAPAANFYGLAAYLGTEPLNQPGNPWSGPYPGTTGATPPNDLWPCFGGSGTAQPDCEYIGSTGTSDPASLAGSVLIGAPTYTWYLQANTATTQPYGCDATTTGDTYHMCAQAQNFYEDDSGDTTDELIFTIEVTQGSDVIYDSGTQDYGPNPYGAISPAPVIIFYEDLVFGIPNGGGETDTGPCFASYNYPSNVPGPGLNYQGLVNTFGGLFGVTAKKTCVAPKAGLATVTITTELAKPTWTGENSLADCPASTMGGPPNSSKPYCYEVKYTKVKSLSQKFNIWFR
jgi:hypothetical protein